MARVITTFVDRREAQRALELARCHDWGGEARLTRDQHGDYWITNLDECIHFFGLAMHGKTCIPATLEEVHKFHAHAGD